MEGMVRERDDIKRQALVVRGEGREGDGVF